MSTADALATVSKAASHVGKEFMEAQARKDALAEKVAVGERFLAASEEMDRKLIELEQDPERRAKAAEQWGQFIDSRMGAWSTGLTADGTAALQQRLIEKRASGGHHARMIEVKDLQDRSNATLVGYGGRFLEAFSRDAGDVPHYVTGPDGVEREVEIPELRDLRDAYGHAVESGAKTKAEAESEIKGLIEKGAHQKAIRMVISEDPEQVARVRALVTNEELKPKSTFLKDVKPESRNSILKAAKEQLEHLRTKANEEEDRARRLGKEREAEWEKRQKEEDNGATTALVLDILGGKAGFAELNKSLPYNQTLRQDPAKVEHVYGLIENRGKAGGTTNWTLYNQIWTRIHETRGAMDATSAVLPYVGKQNGIAREDAEKLITAGKLAGENSVFKDDFFQAGQKDIDRNLQPPVGIIDEAKQRRYAEASREFFDRSSKLVRAGKREEIPGLAREISDRYVKQADRITVFAPKYVPRYPDKESTVQTYVQQYGPSWSWAPSVRQEFDRQIWLHEQIEIERRQKDQENTGGKPGPKPKSQSKLPSPYSQ
jgi:hypothetical protein